MKNFLKKLTSRKLLMAIGGSISAIAVAAGVSDSIMAQLTAIITAGGVIVAYILGESYIDANK